MFFSWVGFFVCPPCTYYWYLLQEEEKVIPSGQLPSSLLKINSAPSGPNFENCVSDTVTKLEFISGIRKEKEECTPSLEERDNRSETEVNTRRLNPWWDGRGRPNRPPLHFFQITQNTRATLRALFNFLQIFFLRFGVKVQKCVQLRNMKLCIATLKP